MTMASAASRLSSTTSTWRACVAACMAWCDRLSRLFTKQPLYYPRLNDSDPTWGTRCPGAQIRPCALPTERTSLRRQARWAMARACRFLLAGCALLAAAPGAAQEPVLRTGSAAHVEAAYLVNFLRFCEWPATAAGDPGTPLVISVVGSERAAKVVKDVVEAAGPIAGRAVLV